MNKNKGIDMQERRQHFRVNDKISLNYRVMHSSEFEQEFHKLQYGVKQKAELRNSLRYLDTRLDIIMERLKKDNPLISEMLGLLNKKLSIHEQLFASVEQDEQIFSTAKKVNLSASGLAFQGETPLSPQTHLKLELVLYPEYDYIPLYAKVVSCRPVKQDSKSGYSIAVEFEGISGEDQEKIIQHIFKLQVENLKQNRDLQFSDNNQDGEASSS